MSHNSLKSIKIRDLDEYRDMDWRFRVTMRHRDDGYVLVPLV